MIVGILAAPCFGLLAQTYADAAAAEEALERQAEALVRRDLASHGWHPVDDEDVLEFAARLQERQGLEILEATHAFRLVLHPDTVSASPPEQSALHTAARVVTEELSRYPKGSLRRARFRRVLLCGGLAEGDLPIPSLPNYQQTLLLDVESRPAFLRRLVHHELFHFIDYTDDDQVLRDPGWSALNDEYFVYGMGGRLMRRPGSAKLTADLPGFLSEYSTSALEEDKAEVFSFLMTAPEAVAKIAARDPVVRRKVTAVRRAAGAVVPQLTEEFWREVEAGNR